MKMIVCAILDLASETYGRPFCMQARGQALRSFSDEVNRSHQDNAMCHHPEHFILYKIADYDDSTGSLTAHPPEQLGLATDFKIKS